MKLTKSINSCVLALAGFATALADIATALVVLAVAIGNAVFWFVGDLVKAAFPLDAIITGHQADLRNSEVGDQISQTGKNVAAFITNLFRVEGRSYHWQAGPAA